MEKIEFETLERVKAELIEYMVVHDWVYKISIPHEKWHEIFKTDECNKIEKSWGKK